MRSLWYEFCCIIFRFSCRWVYSPNSSHTTLTVWPTSLKNHLSRQPFEPTARSNIEENSPCFYPSTRPQAPLEKAQKTLLLPETFLRRLRQHATLPYLGRIGTDAKWNSVCVCVCIICPPCWRFFVGMSRPGSNFCWEARPLTTIFTWHRLGVVPPSMSWTLNRRLRCLFFWWSVCSVNTQCNHDKLMWTWKPFQYKSRDLTR